MQSIITSVRNWVPAVMAVLAVVVASWYAVGRKVEASAGIHDVRTMAEILNDTATSVRASVWSADSLAELIEQESDLTRRIEDSYKQGLVVPQLSELARRGGILVLEIQPVRSAKGSELNAAYPRYRVSIRGSYSAIAGYMQQCGDLRIPLRIVEARINHELADDGEALKTLVADLTVEAFQPEEGPTEQEQEAG